LFWHQRVSIKIHTYLVQPDDMRMMELFQNSNLPVSPPEVSSTQLSLIDYLDRNLEIQMKHIQNLFSKQYLDRQRQLYAFPERYEYRKVNGKYGLKILWLLTREIN